MIRKMIDAIRCWVGYHRVVYRPTFGPNYCPLCGRTCDNFGRTA